LGAEPPPNAGPGTQKGLRAHWLDHRCTDWFTDVVVLEKAGYTANFQNPETMKDLRNQSNIDATVEMADILRYNLEYGNRLPPFVGFDAPPAMPPRRVELTHREYLTVTMLVADFRYRGLTCRKLFSRATSYYRGVACLSPLENYWGSRTELLRKDSCSAATA
jgi:hypothetical protein